MVLVSFFTSLSSNEVNVADQLFSIRRSNQTLLRTWLTFHLSDQIWSILTRCSHSTWELSSSKSSSGHTSETPLTILCQPELNWDSQQAIQESPLLMSLIQLLHSFEHSHDSSLYVSMAASPWMTVLWLWLKHEWCQWSLAMRSDSIRSRLLVSQPPRWLLLHSTLRFQLDSWEEATFPSEVKSIVFQSSKVWAPPTWVKYLSLPTCLFLRLCVASSLSLMYHLSS